MLDSSCSILTIILDTMYDKFGDNFRVFYEIYKNIVKNNQYLDEEFKEKMKALYRLKKTEN